MWGFCGEKKSGNFYLCSEMRILASKEQRERIIPLQKDSTVALEERELRKDLVKMR